MTTPAASRVDPQPPSLPLVLTGATGFVGSALVRHIEAAGPRFDGTRALVRGGAGRLRATRVTAVPGVLPDVPAALFPAQPFVLIHLATKQRDEDGTGYTRVNEQGTRQLLEALPAWCAGVLYGSSMSVYGQGPQLGVDESTPAAPATPLATSRRAAEELLFADGRRTGRSAVALRPRFVIGEGDRFTVPGLARLFARGLSIGDECQRFSVIDVDDYAAVFLALAGRLAERSARGTPLIGPLNVGYRQPVSLRELREALATRRTRLCIPFGPRLQALSAAISRFGARDLLTKLELLGVDHYADVAALAAEIGTAITDRDPRPVLRQAAVGATGGRAMVRDV